MKYKCIMVKYVTYAQIARKILMDKGISVLISRQNYGEKYTCSWCVKVPEQQVELSLQIMNEAKIKMNGEVYDLP